MHYSLVQTVAPTSEPVTIAEAKAQARIDADLTDEDALLQTYIQAARAQVETETGRQLMTATYVYRAADFPACDWIELPKPPLLTVTGVQYRDSTGTLTTWASSNYLVDSYSDPGRVRLVSTASWPSVYDQYDAVQITYTAGYGPLPEDVPDPLRVAILLWVADLYMRREPTGDKQAYVMPLSVERLVWPYRLASVLVG